MRPSLALKDPILEVRNFLTSLWHGGNCSQWGTWYIREKDFARFSAWILEHLGTLITGKLKLILKTLKKQPTCFFSSYTWTDNSGMKISVGILATGQIRGHNMGWWYNSSRVMWQRAQDTAQPRDTIHMRRGHWYWGLVPLQLRFSKVRNLPWESFCFFFFVLNIMPSAFVINPLDFPSYICLPEKSRNILKALI